MRQTHPPTHGCQNPSGAAGRRSTHTNSPGPGRSAPKRLSLPGGNLNRNRHDCRHMRITPAWAPCGNTNHVTLRTPASVSPLPAYRLCLASKSLSSLTMTPRPSTQPTGSRAANPRPVAGIQPSARRRPDSPCVKVRSLRQRHAFSTLFQQLLQSLPGEMAPVALLPARALARAHKVVCLEFIYVLAQCSFRRGKKVGACTLV